MTARKKPAEHLEIQGEVMGGAAQTVATRPETQVTTSEGQTIRTAILEFARDPNFDVEKLRALTDLQNSVEDRQAERAFNIAFVAMQAELPVIHRDGTLEYEKEKGRPETKYTVSKYARYEDIAKAIQPVMAAHGFSISFDVQPRATDGGGLMVSCILRHEAGHVHRGPALPVPLDTSGGKNNIQSYGSALSYGKRYGLFAVLNVITEGDDDDGVAAGGRPISFDEAAQIKGMVAEAGIYNESDTDEERKLKILAWFDDILGYDLPKGYPSIRTEDGVRVRRALLSLKAKRLTQKAEEVKI
jgi:hypothetical protein